MKPTHRKHNPMWPRLGRGARWQCHRFRGVLKRGTYYKLGDRAFFLGPRDVTFRISLDGGHTYSPTKMPAEGEIVRMGGELYRAGPRVTPDKDRNGGF